LWPFTLISVSPTYAQEPAHDLLNEIAFEQKLITMGDQFNVVTVSIDPCETPELAAIVKERYIW
jgi:hypothetical protein